MAEEQPMLMALCERLALRGSCCAVGGSLTGLLPGMVAHCASCPDHLHVQAPADPTDVVLERLEAEADEMWSCVGKKTEKQWIWTAMDATTCQVIALHPPLASVEV